jgi:addiction module HigA family antidote
MRNTKRRPVTVGEMLVTEFLEPMNIEISELAEAMGVHRNTLSRIAHPWQSNSQRLWGIRRSSG